ncbi:MAG TPA: hypothetical protein VNQ33_06615 [Acidimicrobiales bacterium]|nr:hypothetical protein [Acidimicrobiales bacterium]
MLGYAGVLAHQGGWDEALMVIVPVGLFGGLLWVAAKRHAPQDDDPTPPDEGATIP